jgi:ethanolaminephosphotransferase
MVGATALTLAGFSFKLAFTNEDAPELVVGAAKRIVDLTPGFSLVARAQAVFIGLGAATACAMYLIFSKKRAAGKATGQ